MPVVVNENFEKIILHFDYNMSITVENLIDIGLLVVFSLIVWFMSKTKKTLVKSEGLIMVLIYFAYLAYIIARNYVL